MGVETLTAILAALFDDHDALIASAVADGWPRPMVAEGFAMHRQTWQPAEIAAAVTAASSGTVPRTLAHLWPALPGAGVTPVLFAYLLGVPQQRIKASARGTHFARHFVQTWQRFDSSLSLSGDWRTADRVVVSGSDETVTAVIDAIGRENVAGYGHRVSFAVVVDSGEAWPVDDLATDIVMWHTTGCFSARAVVFEGDQSRAREFARVLALAITRAEQRLQATSLTETELSQRMQRLGQAEFETEVWKSALGWVELREQWSGDRVGPNAVVLCTGRPERVVAVDREHLQGVAWAGEEPERAVAMGATRVCRPGELQQPPADWPHDGVGSVAALTGLANGRIGS